MKGFDSTDAAESVNGTDIPARSACVKYTAGMAFSRSEFPVIGVETNEEMFESNQPGNLPFENQELSKHADEGSYEVTTTIRDDIGRTAEYVEQDRELEPSPSS